MNGPVILCGLGSIGWRVLEFLQAAGIRVVVINRTIDAADPRLVGVQVVQGDFRERTILQQAGVHEATGVIIVTSDDLVNISAALMVRSINGNVRIVLRMFNQNLVAHLGKAVRNMAALSVSALSAPILAITALSGDVLAAFSLPDGPRQIAEVSITENASCRGQRLGNFDPVGRFLLLGHIPAGQSARILHAIDPDACIEVGDKLVICGRPGDVRKFLEPSWEHRFEVLWAGKLRRYGRLIWRAFREMDLAVKICSLTLICVVLFSTLLYHYGLNHTWPDGVYRSISVIATGAEMGGGQYEGWGKVFVSFLRVTGIALVAAFTAIFTNYMLRARLGGAFEMRRIPDRGHVVVCGLGNVGFRVVEQLRKLDESVVVVERKLDNAFVASCRRQGAAVVHGDCTVKDVLQQARVETASAVIAATSSDLVNLEISLLVADLYPQQRVVVRLGDSALAETVRRAASVRLALSVAELAAPAFLASLLGDRVQGIFIIAGRLLTILEIAVPAEDSPLLIHSVRALSVDYRFAPVACTTADGAVKELRTGTRLNAGDRLTVITTLEEVDRLIRRDPIPKPWSVEITAYPLSAREDLVMRVCALRGLPEKEGEQMVNQTPFMLADGLTRGEAEEFAGLMKRERVETKLYEAAVRQLT
jgi:Trk K+ transport system NAD-binding subunit